MTIRRIEDGVLVRSYKSLDLSIANADALIFGGVAKEGGDIKVYRDTAGNLQMSVDADAASNAKALDIYGGVVAQNYLTVGQAALNTAYQLYVVGHSRFSDTVTSDSHIYCGLTRAFRTGTGGLNSRTDNIAVLPITIGVSGTNATNHAVALQIDANDIIVAQATGDGAGGITNKAVGLYGTTPTTQAAAISDPAESTAANNAAIDSILAALRGIGLIAT